jgi:hypothetical protein
MIDKLSCGVQAERRRRVDVESRDVDVASERTRDGASNRADTIAAAIRSAPNVGEQGAFYRNLLRLGSRLASSVSTSTRLRS